MGVMEGESAIQAVHGPALEAARRTGEGGGVSGEVAAAVEEMRADYEHQLDARYAAARGFVDAIVHPEETTAVLAQALRAALHNPGPHIGPFVLPPMPEPVR
jgi:acetyl-CoA carboxylase carboxyltransferase component